MNKETNMEINNEREPYVDTKTLQKFLNAKKSWVYEMVAKRELPSHRVGGKYFFKLSEIDQAMQARKYA
jgi:excisionase family DNA binding protein